MNSKMMNRAGSHTIKYLNKNRQKKTLIDDDGNAIRGQCTHPILEIDIDAIVNRLEHGIQIVVSRSVEKLCGKTEKYK